MTRDSIAQLAAAGLFVASMGASVFLSADIAASFGRNKLGYADRAEDSDPPEVGIGIAMGAFRGVFVNYLWLRANKAKDKGNYYEAIDLAKTITKLQPRFPRVWAFHAWNMAYNISVATNTAEERWQWVNAGIRLLRDEGIPANPGDLLLHKELGWIYLHKIQGTMDDANQLYKRRFANEWNVILGTPPKFDLKNKGRDKAIADYVAWLKRISDAPTSLAEVGKAKPIVDELVKRLKDEVGADLDSSEDRMRILSGIEIGRSLSRLQANLKGIALPTLEGALVKLLTDEKMFPAWEVVVPHLRKRVLIENYHMEPDRMIEYTKKFGPIDWRHASGHAVYWAQRGVDEAQKHVGEANAKDFDFLNADRVVIQAVQDLYRSGTVYFDVLKPDKYLALPNAHFIRAYRDSIEDMLRREESYFLALRGNDGAKNPYNMYKAGYENFTRDAIAFLYRRGDKEEARQFQTQLLADMVNKKLNFNNPTLEHELTKPLDEFVVDQVKDRITSPDIARAEVFGALYGAFASLLTDDREQFDAQWDYAKKFHEAFMKEQYRQVGVDPTKARMEVLPRDWTEAATTIFASVLNLLGLEEASIIYARVPDDRLRAMAYDEMALAMKQGVDEQAKTSGTPTFNALFPPPPGLAAYRKEKADKEIEAPRKGDTELK